MSKHNPYAILSFLILLGLIYSTFFPSRFHFSSLLRQPPMSFAGRNGTHFIELDGDTPLYINGWNSYWLMSSGSEAFVSEMLRRGRDMGMTLCRTWAFSDGSVGPLQISPGRFDDRLFQAWRNGIRLIPSLVNNLDKFGGKEQYVKWAEAAGVNSTWSPDLFFSDETVKGYYKDYDDFNKENLL